MVAGPKAGGARPDDPACASPAPPVLYLGLGRPQTRGVCRTRTGPAPWTPALEPAAPGPTTQRVWRLFVFSFAQAQGDGGCDLPLEFVMVRRTLRLVWSKRIEKVVLFAQFWRFLCGFFFLRVRRRLPRRFWNRLDMLAYVRLPAI